MFYDNFLKLCAKKGVSQSGAAKAIGLSNAAASGWKSGKQPSDVTLEKLALYFGVSVDELTGETKKEPATLTGDGLDDLQKQAFDLIKKIPTEQLQTFIGVLKAILGES